MRIWMACFVLASAVVGGAQESQLSRTLTEIGGFATLGDDSGTRLVGWGASLRTLTFFDPWSPEGTYYGFLGSALTRSIGDEGLSDVRLVTLGYRGNLLSWFGWPDAKLFVDASVSPTLGSRSRGNLILGSLYTGIGLTLGFHIPLWDGNDLGFSWEPVIPLARWGNPTAPNMGYQDFLVCWTVKQATRVTPLAW